MATEEHSPVICVTCQRPFPLGLTQKESPRYFAQHHLLPTAEDDTYLGHEAETLLNYIHAVAVATHTSQELTEHEHAILLGLIEDLSEEALRRLRLSLAAMNEHWARRHAAHPCAESGRKG